MPYDIGGVPFRTKSEITDHCRQILHLTKDGKAVAEEARRFLIDLFSRFHEQWHHKAQGHETKDIHFFVQESKPHKTKHFVMRKADGAPLGDDADDDISFGHTIKRIPSSRSAKADPHAQQRKDVRDAARSAVIDQIWAFRDAHLVGGPLCELTGQRISRDNCDVDHRAPLTLNRLLEDFIRLNGIDIIAVDVGSRHGTEAVFMDKSLEARWQRYHQEHADLRLLSKEGHRSLKKGSS